MKDACITLKDILKKREINIDHSLDSSELQELSKEFNLEDIKSLKVDFKILPIANNKGISVSGTMKGLVIHSCVITLGPVPQSINENISIRYTPNGVDDVIDKFPETELDNLYSNTDYDVEELIDSEINISDIIREYLSLSLLTNPRVANARFDGFTVGDLSQQEKHHIDKNLERIVKGKQPVADNPFASLASLKQKTE